MKKEKLIVLLVLSIILSAGIVRTKTESQGAYPCLPTERYCVDTGAGVKYIRKQGYPLTYREKEVFYPNDTSAASSYTNEIDGFSLPRVLLGSVFWFGLLFTALSLYEGRKVNATKKAASAKKKNKTQ